MAPINAQFPAKLSVNTGRYTDPFGKRTEPHFKDLTDNIISRPLSESGSILIFSFELQHGNPLYKTGKSCISFPVATKKIHKMKCLIPQDHI